MMAPGGSSRRTALTVAIALAMLTAGAALGALAAGGAGTVRTVVTTERVAETITVPAIEERTVVVTERVTIPVIRERVSIIDALGRRVEFEHPPRRVVSLAPSITETLFALGLGGRVVGVTSHCNYPPEVPELVREGEIEIVGGFWTPDLEKILALEPDLVIGSAGTPPHLRLRESLEHAGVRVVYVHGTAAIDKHQVYADMRTLARIFGADAVAEDLIARIEGEVSRVEAAVPREGRPKVLVLLGPPAWGLWSAGSNTFIGWALRTAGGVNVAERFSGWPLLDYEFVLSQDPDVIIVSAMGADYTALIEEIRSTPLAETKAFRSGRIYVVDLEANDVLVRPGPRLGLAVRLLAAILYPELFGPVDIPVVYKMGEGTLSPGALAWSGALAHRYGIVGT